MVFVCRGSWWTVPPVPGDEAGRAVGELRTMEGDWAQDLSLSLFVIHHPVHWILQLPPDLCAHACTLCSKRCRINYCGKKRCYCLTSFHVHNERLQMSAQYLAITELLELLSTLNLFDQHTFLATLTVWIVGHCISPVGPLLWSEIFWLTWNCTDIWCPQRTKH